ncbi:MAG: cyclic nucleotide-binding domain-containing protein [Desulfatiglandaceae bacterium]
MDFNTVRSAITRSSVFRGLDQAQLGMLLMSASAREFSSGEEIYSKGEESEGSFALIVSGRVSVVAESGQILKELGAGEVIGEVGIISPQQRRTVTVRTIQPTVAFEWQLRDIEEKLPELVKTLKDLAWKRVSDWLE